MSAFSSLNRRAFLKSLAANRFSSDNPGIVNKNGYISKVIRNVCCDSVAFFRIHDI